MGKLDLSYKELLAKSEANNAFLILRFNQCYKLFLKQQELAIYFRDRVAEVETELLLRLEELDSLKQA